MKSKKTKGRKLFTRKKLLPRKKKSLTGKKTLKRNYSKKRKQLLRKKKKSLKGKKKKSLTGKKLQSGGIGVWPFGGSTPKLITFHPPDQPITIQGLCEKLSIGVGGLTGLLTSLADSSSAPDILTEKLCKGWQFNAGTGDLTNSELLLSPLTLTQVPGETAVWDMNSGQPSRMWNLASSWVGYVKKSILTDIESTESPTGSPTPEAGGFKRFTGAVGTALTSTKIAAVKRAFDRIQINQSVEVTLRVVKTTGGVQPPGNNILIASGGDEYKLYIGYTNDQIGGPDTTPTNQVNTTTQGGQELITGRPYMMNKRGNLRTYSPCMKRGVGSMFANCATATQQLWSGGGAKYPVDAEDECQNKYCCPEGEQTSTFGTCANAEYNKTAWVPDNEDVFFHMEDDRVEFETITDNRGVIWKRQKQ